jgi:hypothetical protein
MPAPRNAPAEKFGASHVEKFVLLAQEIVRRSFHGRVPEHAEMPGVLVACLQVFCDGEPAESCEEFCLNLCAGFDCVRHSTWTN